MSLAKYQQKRSFEKTPEPKGGKASKNALRFVIQKHDASHLHYDFRLEMEGVLKSWAIPKGPTTDPSVKRLAMMVEDHPYDYRTFEGTIPDGNYGAGTVIVWDEGLYEPIEKLNGKALQEKELLKELKSGSLKIILHGKKLKGEFALVKTKGMAENAWLFIKHKDKYAATSDITLKDKSVISQKTIAQMAKLTDKIYVPKKAAAKTKAVIKQIKSPKILPKENDDIPETLSGTAFNKGTRKAFYTTLKPMLATLIDQPFEEDGWIYEIKWDGYRAIGFINKGKVSLKSRNNISFKDKFKPVYEALQEWHINAIIDGEIVALNEKGLPDFEMLQNSKDRTDLHLVYYVFDILWLNGKDLTKLTLVERRAILKSVLPDNNIIQFSDDFKTTAKELLQQVKSKGLEGIMAKKSDSLYKPDSRSKEWLKIKDNSRQEMVIGGYTINVDSSKPFSALLMGVFKDDKFIFTGKVGTGFGIEQQKDLLKKMESLTIDKSPFEEPIKTKGHSSFYIKPTVAKTIWIQPKLVAEIAFTEMTKDNVMRHPSFIALREDKKTKEVILEKPLHTKAIISKTKSLKISKSNSIKHFIDASAGNTVTKKVNKHELTFNNLNKLYWSKEKITKRDLINYYHSIAPYILPYLKDRPQSLNRNPSGITGQSFYQKDVTGKVPEWADLFPYQSEGDNRQKNFLLGNNEATLLYMAGLGCIEMNPWSSTIKKPENPTWCVIDLDPSKNSFDDVIEAAQVTHQILDSIHVPNYPKTSGSTGIHIYIPLGAKYTYDQSKEFARIIVHLVQKELPSFTSIERSVKDRKGKMYLDFLQNRNQATLAAPYSCRPKPGATVSMPLHWNEVKKGLKMSDFHIFNAYERVQEMGDIFKPVLGKGIDMKKAIDNALNSYDITSE